MYVYTKKCIKQENTFLVGKGVTQPALKIIYTWGFMLLFYYFPSQLWLEYDFISKPQEMTCHLHRQRNVLNCIS